MEAYGPGQAQLAFVGAPTCTVWPTQSVPSYVRADISDMVVSGAQHRSEEPASHSKQTVSPMSLPAQYFEKLAPTSPDENASSSCPAPRHESGSGLYAQKPACQKPARVTSVLPQTSRLPSYGGVYAITQAPGTGAVPGFSSAHTPGCMTGVGEACRGWCWPESAGGVVASIPAIGSPPAGASIAWTRIPEAAPGQHALWSGELTSSMGLAEGAAAPFESAGQAAEGGQKPPQPETPHAIPFKKTLDRTAPEECLYDKGTPEIRETTGGAVRNGEETAHAEKRPDETSGRAPPPPPLENYAVFLPQRTKLEKLRKHDEVPVMFKLFHRRERVHERGERLEPPRPAAAAAAAGFGAGARGKQVFHFRVLQRQQPKDEEERRLVAFRTPAHYRQDRVFSFAPQRPSAPRPFFYRRPGGYVCGDDSERLRSTSSGSSLLTLQYAHNRVAAPPLHVHVCQPPQESHDLLGRVAVSRAASRIAQETIRRVARRRAARRRAKVTKAPKVAQGDEELEGIRKPRKCQKAQIHVDLLWCCDVRGESGERPESSVNGDDTDTFTPTIEGKSRKPRTRRSSQATEAEEQTPGQKLEPSEVQSAASDDVQSAAHAKGLCETVGYLLGLGSLCAEETKMQVEPLTYLPSLSSEDAIEGSCSPKESKVGFPEQPSPRPGIFSISSRSRPAVHEETSEAKESASPSSTPKGISPESGTGRPRPPATWVDPGEDMHPLEPVVAYPQTTSGDVPPLYSLPVVSFLPPVFEPLPVIESESVCSPAQLSVCCSAGRPASTQMWTSQNRKMPVRPGNVQPRRPAGLRPQIGVSPHRVKVCVLPARTPPYCS